MFLLSDNIIDLKDMEYIEVRCYKCGKKFSVPIGFGNGNDFICFDCWNKGEI